MNLELNMNLECLMFVKNHDDMGYRLVRHLKHDPWVRQVLDMLYSNFVQTDNHTWKDISNTSRTYPQTVVNTITTSYGVDTYGIVVGTGTNAVGVSDYTLHTKIANGSGAGQLYYLACYKNAPSLSGSTYTTEWYREFRNISGGLITVEEVGIYGLNTYSFLLARDLTGGVAVPDKNTLFVKYRFATTV